MPKFEVTSPDGRKFEVTGPPGSTRQQAIEWKRRQLADEEAERLDAAQPSVGVEAGRGAARGLVVGAEAVPAAMITPLGAVGQLAGAAAPYIEAGYRKLGMATPESERLVEQREQLGKQIEEDRAKSWWTSPAKHAQEAVPEPTTRTGRMIESIAGAAPSAVFQPGGTLTKIITTLGTGVGGELGEEMGGGWGRFFGSFFGGLSSARMTTAAQRGAARLIMSTGEQNRASAKQAIDMINQAGLVIEPTEVQNFAAGLRADLSSGTRMFEDVVGAGRPGFNAAERIEAANGDLATILNVHSGLGTIPPSRGSDYVSAMVARDAIREWVGNLQPNQIIRGDAQFISGMWQHHRDTWRIHSNLEAIRDVTQSADLRRLASGTGANLNTMRQEIRKIIDNDRKARRYSPEAREEMLRVVEGGWIRNLVRQVSKYAPHGPVSGIPTMLGLLSAEPSIGAVIAATGIGGHLLSHLLEASSMRRLDAVIRSASPLTTAGARRMFQTAPGRGPRRGAAAIRAALDVGAGSALAEPEPQE